MVLTNTVIIGIHLFLLWQCWTDEEYFSLLEVLPGSGYLNEFLAFHAEEIVRSQPEFSFAVTEDDLIVFVLRDMVPAGLVIGTPSGGDFAVELDYVRPGSGTSSRPGSCSGPRRCSPPTVIGR